jgi:DNA-binding CsgD family transcriptional regulator
MAISAAVAACRRHRDEVVALCLREGAGWDLLPELGRRLRRLVAYDASFWSGADPATSLARTPVFLENLDGVDCHSFWEREFLVEDVNPFRDLARSARPVASLRAATDARPARSARYRELLAPFGYADELRAVFRAGRCPWGMASFFRAGDDPFDDEEVALVADLAPAIGEAFRRAAVRRPGQATGAAFGPGLMLFDPDGCLESLNEQATAWLDELRDASIDDEAAPWLPTEILVVVAHARAIAAGRERGPARTRLQTPLGRWLTVEATPLLKPRDTAGRTALVLQPAAAWEIAPLIAEAHGLTPREQEVTRLIARGLTTAEVADELFLSIHTVRDHVKQIFQKIGISSRGELVARLFCDHYLEPLLDDVRTQRF